MTAPGDLTDDEITTALRSVADDASVRAPNRASIRDRMLAETTVRNGSRGIVRTNVINLHRDVDDPEPAAIIRHRSSRSILTLVAAVATATVALGALIAWRGTVDAPSNPVPVPTTPPWSIDAAAVPSELPAGLYASSLAGGVLFELDEQVTLIERSDAVVTLAIHVAGGGRSLVSLVDADPGTYRSAMSDAVAVGDVRIDPAAYRDKGLRLEITERGAAVWGCQPEVNCIVGDLPIPLALGLENYLTPIDFEIGGGLVLLERSSNPKPSAPAVASTVLATIKPFGLAAPSPSIVD